MEHAHRSEAIGTEEEEGEGEGHSVLCISIGHGVYRLLDTMQWHFTIGIEFYGILLNLVGSKSNSIQLKLKWDTGEGRTGHEVGRL